VSTIGFGDVTPITDAERAVLLLLELTGVLFFGILLSSITSLLQVGTRQHLTCSSSDAVSELYTTTCSMSLVQAVTCLGLGQWLCWSGQPLPATVTHDFDLRCCKLVHCDPNCAM